jgi:hypothetical protein
VGSALSTASGSRQRLATSLVTVFADIGLSPSEVQHSL